MAVKPGWQEFSVDDAVAIEVAASLAAQGLKKTDARVVVDAYFDLALERAADPKCRRPIYLGVAESFGIAGGVKTLDDHHQLIGSINDIADEICRLEAALHPKHHVGVAIIASLNLGVETVLTRADEAGLSDQRLDELANLFRLQQHRVKSRLA